ncbi:MAG: DUF4340 domain-containing protein [Verrucomicrobiae bacterium]|nr:DUF4340 domain-containing protein [Verrucomicrobiae bacterium]
MLFILHAHRNVAHENVAFGADNIDRADVATDLGKYGLAEPILTITLAGAETNGVMTLLVGAPDPRGERRYLKRNDEPFIYGVSSNAVAWVPTSRLAYRARRVAELNPAEITKLVVERGKEKIVTQRGADQRWRVLEPADAALATNRFHQVLELLAFLRAEQFIGENMERLDAYGLDKPTHRFTIETLTKTYLLQLGKHTDGLTYASWSDPATIFTVTAAAVHTLTNSFIGVATAASSSSIGTVPQAQAP